MKELETFMKTVGEGLRALAKGVHAIADKLDSFVPDNDDSEPEFEPAVTNIHSNATEETPENADSPKEPKISATTVVYETIRNSKVSISIDKLSKETGFDKRKLNNILYRLRKQGKIKSVKKGLYAKK